MSTPTAAPSAERTPLDRFLAAIPWAVAALTLLSLLFWEVALRRTPTIFTDELEWTQLSRAIAATGHAARRGHSFSFSSLYSYLIAPAWWLGATGRAYGAIKYLNAVVMALAAVPTYLVARDLVPRRVAGVAALAVLCTSAFFYAGYLLPEVLAYPTFALCAWVSIRALAGGGRRWVVAAVVLDLAAVAVRGQLMVILPSFAVAAGVLWVVGPRGRRLRSGWSRADHAGAAVLLVGVVILLNAILGPHVHQWWDVTQYWQGRMWSLGMQASSALALGLGLLPFVGGLASLWLPERRHDPHWRAFAAFTAAAIVFVWLYTGVKAAYLSTIFATRVEERNMIYLGPLLLVGTAVWLCSRQWLPGALAAFGLTAWLVLYYGYQLDYPYFEAPGYGIAVLANRSWRLDQPHIRIGLAIACGVLLSAVILPRAVRAWSRAGRGLVALALAGTLAWLLAGSVTSAQGAGSTSQAYAAHLPQPFDWIDRADHGQGATFLGQNLATGQSLGVDLDEFWNHSIKNVWSLDGSAPGPGPTLTPDLRDRYGTLSHDPSLPYVVAANGVDVIGQLVASRPNLRLVRLPSHPWRLHDAAYGVSDDGWTSAPDETVPARAVWAYFGPQTTPGVVVVHVGRAGFCAPSAPPTHVVIRIGPLALNQQNAPTITHREHVRRLLVPSCSAHTVRVRIAPPLAVIVTDSPTVQPTQYGIGDNRHLGVQVDFSFAPGR